MGVPLDISLRDWVGDFTHENGNYQSTCLFCGQPFTGHKRRFVCHICADLVQVVDAKLREVEASLAKG